MEKQISIVIPCFNVEKCIEKCVESINTALSEKNKQFEIILVDDGSLDSTPKICDELANKYNNVSCIHKPNGGLSDARNAGIEAASGKYVVFVDGDDYVNSEMTKIFDFVDMNFDIVAWGLVISNGDTIIEYRRIEHEVEWLNFTDIEKTQYFKQKHYDNAVCHMYKKEFLLQNNLRFLKGVYYEDVEFMSRAVFFAKSFKIVDICYYIYNVGNSESITRAMKLKNYTDFFIVLNSMIDFGDGHIKDKNYYKAYRQCHSRIFYGLLVNHNKVKRQYKKEIIDLFIKNKKLRKYPMGFRNKFLNFLISVFGIRFVLKGIMSTAKLLGK